MNMELKGILRRVNSVSKVFSSLENKSCSEMVFSDHHGNVVGRLCLQNGHVLADNQTDVEACINKYLLGQYALNVLDTPTVNENSSYQKRELKDFICETLKEVDFLIQQAFMSNLNQLWLAHGLNNASKLDVKSRTREDLYLFIFFYNSPRPICDFGKKFPKIDSAVLISSIIRLTILGYLKVSADNPTGATHARTPRVTGYAQERRASHIQSSFASAQQKRGFLEKLFKRVNEI